jgi:hypothetical protein
MGSECGVCSIGNIEKIKGVRRKEVGRLPMSEMAPKGTMGIQCESFSSTNT